MSRSTAKQLTRDERLQEVIVEAIGDGWEAELSPGGHIKFTHPYVDEFVFGPSSPSDHRASKNLRSRLRRTLRQAVDEKFSRLGSDPEFAKDVDEAIGDHGMFDCSACRGQGKRKGFLSAQALAAHMAKQHPAAPLMEEPEPTPLMQEPEPEDDMSDTATGTMQELEALRRMTELFDDYCLNHQNEPFTIDDVIEELNLPNTRNVRRSIANRVTTAKKQKERNPRRRRFLANPSRGVYKYVTPDSTEDVKVEGAKVGGATSVPSGRLYEWVTETTDGRHIVKDDQGKVYFATFTEL